MLYHKRNNKLHLYSQDTLLLAADTGNCPVDSCVCTSVASGVVLKLDSFLPVAF